MIDPEKVKFGDVFEWRGDPTRWMFIAWNESMVGAIWHTLRIGDNKVTVVYWMDDPHWVQVG
jgi:hypothetical protein